MTDSTKKHFRTTVTIEHWIEIRNDELDKALVLAKLSVTKIGNSAKRFQAAKVYGNFSDPPKIVEISEPVEIE